MGSSPLPVSLQSKLQKATGSSRFQSLSSNINIFRNLVFAIFLLRLTRKSYYFLRGHGILGSLLIFYRAIRKRSYKIFLAAPGVRNKVSQQVAAAQKDIETKLASHAPGTIRYLSLPKEPWAAEKLTAELDKLAAIKRTRWEEGKVSGAVYHGEDQLLEIQAQAMKLFSVANPIHADVFPAVRKMEAEVVAMTLALFNGPDGSAGATTSGGTESILMACLSARQKAYYERGVTEPEMIIPVTAHAAFEKAAAYFKIKLHHAPCPAPAYQVDIPSVRRLITPNTVLLVGSAPNYAHGNIDSIPQLSALALHHKIPLHVDCCLGSFIMPMLSSAGFPSPFAEEGGFTFTQPGVTSISVDTHKYGFAPKGNSVILYRTKKLRQYQYFITPEWTGGVYGSPSIAGSRPGALIAGAWASMMSLGEKGYRDAAHKIVSTRITIQNAVMQHPVLKETITIMGDPVSSVLAFESTDPAIDIYDIADAMSAKGWHLNSIQNPPGLHVAVTLPMTKAGAVDSLIDDLVEVVRTEKERALERARKTGVLEPRKKGTSAQLYGVAGSLPDKSIVERIVVAYLDTLYLA